MEEVRAVVIGLDLRTRQQPAGVRIVQLLDFGLDVLQGGQRVLALAQEHDARDLVVLVVTDVGEREGGTRGPLDLGAVIADPSQPGLVADHDTLLAGQLIRGKPSPLDHVFDPDRLVVDRSDDQAADLPDPAQFLRTKDRGGGLGAFHAQHLVHRVQAAAKEADAPHRHGNLPLVEVVAAHRGVAVGERCLELTQRDAIAAEPVRVGLHLIASHRAAEAA